jgi:hypothetical protein
MRIQKRQLFIIGLLVFLPAAVSWAIEEQKAQAFAGQDLHLRGGELISYQPNPGEHTLILQDGFSMSIGANQFFSDSAVVWLVSVTTEFRGRIQVDYMARAYLEGNVSIKKGKSARTTDLSEKILEKDQAMFVRVGVSGEVFVTAEKRQVDDPRGLELYKRAEASIKPVAPRFFVEAEALVPELPPQEIPPEKPVEEVVAEEAVPEKKEVVAEPRKPGFIEGIFEREEKPPEVTGGRSCASDRVCQGAGRDRCYNGYRQILCVAEAGRKGRSAGITG